MLLSRHPFHRKFYFLPVTGKCEGNQRPQAPGWNFTELFLLGTSTEEWKFPLGGVLCSMQQAITSPQGLQKWHKAHFCRCKIEARRNDNTKHILLLQNTLLGWRWGALTPNPGDLEQAGKHLRELWKKPLEANLIKGKQYRVCIASDLIRLKGQAIKKKLCIFKGLEGTAQVVHHWDTYPIRTDFSSFPSWHQHRCGSRHRIQPNPKTHTAQIQHQ